MFRKQIHRPLSATTGHFLLHYTKPIAKPMYIIERKNNVHIGLVFILEWSYDWAKIKNENNLSISKYHALINKQVPHTYQ